MSDTPDINASRVPDSEKQNKDLKLREIKEHFLPLIYELNDLQVHIATLEISNSRKAVTAIKKGLSEHKKHTDEFRRMIGELGAGIDKKNSQERKLKDHEHHVKFHGAKSMKRKKDF